MIIRIARWSFVLALACIAATASADQITMKDGQVLEGKIVGRANGMVTLEIAGQKLNIPEPNIASMQVTMGDSPAPAAAPAAQPAPAPAAVPPPPEIKPTVPAGTRLSLRMAETVSTKSHKAGQRFTAKLEADLVTGGVVIAPRGSTVYGQLVSAQKSRRVAGSSEMTIIFTDILINNQMYPIATETLSGKTDNTAKKSTRRVARGAALGGLIDGSDGAKTGAKVGAGAAILTGGEQINLPAGTLLEAQLRAPFTPE